jgi:hypothetical protein
MDIRGWTEEEIRNKDLMAPCGLYCGACGIYIATRDENKKFQAIMGRLYGTKPEETVCLGCMQRGENSTLYGYCDSCGIRECINEKGFYSCHQCDAWPCQQFTGFGFPIGVRVRERAIPLWRQKVAQFGHEQGSIEWARAEVNRYHCSSCGEPLFRGAQRCRACKRFVADELDGSP